MGSTIDLTASDGHRLTGYLAEPAATPAGAVIIIQEIFGVTRHIRAVCDEYAAAGYRAIAPALFDRVERGVELPYDQTKAGLAFKQAIPDDKTMLDVSAAIDAVRGAGKVAVIGYCWGGTIAYLAATRLNVDAAIAYYGGEIARHLAEKPRAPVLFHFGKNDSHIPMQAVEAIRSAYPEGIFHLYDAGHGFNCTERASFEAASSALAFRRSIEFLHQHLG